MKTRWMMKGLLLGSMLTIGATAYGETTSALEQDFASEVAANDAASSDVAIDALSSSEHPDYRFRRPRRVHFECIAQNARGLLFVGRDYDRVTAAREALARCRHSVDTIIPSTCRVSLSRDCHQQMRLRW